VIDGIGIDRFGRANGMFSQMMLDIEKRFPESSA